MLSDEEHAMIDLAAEFWRHEALREDAMRERFGLTPTRFWQKINVLIDRPEALMVEPVKVRLLRGRRAQRRHRRAG